MTALPWNFLQWQQFETLSVYLAQDLFKHPFFEKYLKSGNDQQGIDIRDNNPKSDMVTYLQCKHEKLSEAKLKKVFPGFLKRRNGRGHADLY